MLKAKKKFAVYLSSHAVEFCEKEENYLGSGRLICSQTNHDNLLKFAKNLAINRQLSLQILTKSQVSL